MHDSPGSMGPFPGEPGGPGNAARAFSGGAPSHPPSGPPLHPSSIDDTPHRARSGWPDAGGQPLRSVDFDEYQALCDVLEPASEPDNA